MSKTIISSRAAILEALRSGDGSGPELIDRVLKRTQKKVRLQQGAVYLALRTLEREKLIKSYHGEAKKRGGRPKNHYTLTKKGVRVAQQNRETIDQLFARNKNKKKKQVVAVAAPDTRPPSEPGHDSHELQNGESATPA